MTDASYPADHDRLVDNIHKELEAQKAIGDLPLDAATLAELASAVAANVEYAFDLSWAPRWVEGGDPHRWVEQSASSASGESHFVECLSCRLITEHLTAEQADEWWSSHVRDASHIHV